MTAKMQLISTNVFPAPIGHSVQKQNLPTRFGLRYCPSMDLVAVFPQTIPCEQAIEALESKETSGEDYYAEDEDELFTDVYRLNGQKVFTIGIDSQGGSIGIVDVAWRDDGVIFAIVTTDNTTRLVNSFSGKVIHTFTSKSSTNQLPPRVGSVPNSPTAKRRSSARDGGPRKRRCMPTSIHYSTLFQDTESIRSRFAAVEGEKGLVLDDLLGLNADIEQLLKLKADLPKEFASIDVENFLPKLSTLPANGMGEDDIFSTRTSIDAMFHPTKQNARTISTDIVTIPQSDACVHVRIFDSFEVGDIDLNRAHNLPSGCKAGKVRLIASHPLSEKVYVIAEEQDVASSPRSTRSHNNPKAQRHSLHLLDLDLRFLQQSRLTLPILAAKATQLHNLVRYLKQIEGQLAREIRQAFDLPRRFIRNLEEDLKEQDGEGSTFETSAYHVLLTGEVYGKFKEWLVEILGERGVKRWEKAVSDCLELVRRLVNESWNPAVERAGVVVSRLSGLAGSNAKFGIEKSTLDDLRDTIDMMAITGEQLLREANTEISGFNAFITWLKREIEMAGLEDTSEKLDEMREGSDHSEVRKVMKYISERLNESSIKKYVDDSGTPNGPESVKVGIQTIKDSWKTGTKTTNQLPKLSLKTLVNRLGEECGTIFQQVAVKLQDGILVGYVRKLGDETDGEMLDGRIVYEHEQASLHLIGKHVAATGQLCWTKQPLRGVVQGKSLASSIVTLSEADNVMDVKFIDDHEIMVLTRTATQATIISINLKHESKQTVRHMFGDRDDRFTKSGLQPWRIEANGRKGRRTLTVLDEQGRGYGVLDLDGSDDIADDDDEPMGMI